MQVVQGVQHLFPVTAYLRFEDFSIRIIHVKFFLVLKPGKKLQNISKQGERYLFIAVDVFQVPVKGSDFFFIQRTQQGKKF
ncbi:MAG TPA: hypothetical protein PK228_11615 [Saprospiraceae bacterium]|nr:hypothetical protein [Saprospiraceae bacterium]